MTSLMLFSTGGIVAVSILGAILLGFIIYLCFVPMKAWFTALFGGRYIPTWKLISIKGNKIDTQELVKALLMAKKTGVNLSLADIETIMLNGGSAINIIKALSLSEGAGIKITKTLATAIEIASGNVCEVIQQTIDSKLLTIENIKATTQDNMEIIVSASVSVKMCLARYISGVSEEDLKSTVSSYILDNIAKAKSYKALLKEPNQMLLSHIDLKTLGQKSKYNVLDVNISSIETGRDLNAEREIQVAEKEKVYAQIEAERMKNVEQIKELQMRTKTEKMKADVLQAEAEVPTAISQAIKEGRFSVMDYYKLMNLQADTALRRAIIDNKDSGEGDEY